MTRLKIDAEIIADIIAKTPPEERHELYNEIASKLREKGASYTASLFEAISKADKDGKEL